jgi:2-amino-4-hydroxy-6-hydroxymethyldihydropteridine diphosphokinase
METGFSFGSNEGDRVANIREAKKRIMALPGVVFRAQSPLYETEPVGVLPEYADIRFLNSVLIVDSAYTPAEWLEHLHKIEKDLGRTRLNDRNAPRSIDVDILYVGDACIDSGGLTVPHPRWAKRRFVVQPLADVRPDLVLPGAGKTVREILSGLEGEEVTALSVDW